MNDFQGVITEANDKKNTPAEMFALNQYLSEHTGSYADVIKALSSRKESIDIGDEQFNGVVPWEPFESYNASDIASYVESAKENVDALIAPYRAITNFLFRVQPSLTTMFDEAVRYDDWEAVNGFISLAMERNAARGETLFGEALMAAVKQDDGNAILALHEHWKKERNGQIPSTDHRFYVNAIDAATATTSAYALEKLLYEIDFRDSNGNDLVAHLIYAHGIVDAVPARDAKQVSSDSQIHVIAELHDVEVDVGSDNPRIAEIALSRDDIAKYANVENYMRETDTRFLFKSLGASVSLYDGNNVKMELGQNQADIVFEITPSGKFVSSVRSLDDPMQLGGNDWQTLPISWGDLINLPLINNNYHVISDVFSTDEMLAAVGVEPSEILMEYAGGSNSNPSQGRGKPAIDVDNNSSPQP